MSHAGAVLLVDAVRAAGLDRALSAVLEPWRRPTAVHDPAMGFDVNRIWCAVVQLACELLACTQMLGFTDHPARRWEPKRLRLRLFATAGRLARHAHALVVHLAADRGWTELVLTARTALTGAPARPG